ncbi:rare lipoprotein A [Polaromonas sp. CG_9.5]|uniref:septal ring lytic transglycosylase RlpA family protein n=1 Tax=Polaromonas sp. CG_9.5 TaxID=3071705 RepID=UPI002E06FD97|nr:rare lipoprotein A [Polaromonas sp. CG_9.5]
MQKILRIALLVFFACSLGAVQAADRKVSASHKPKAAKAQGQHPVHYRGTARAAVKHPVEKTGKAGKSQTGKASFYSHRLSGKKMAGGERMNPNSNNAASKTLPIGTRARVTNLHNGKSAIVVIKDRGPHVRGRIIDVSPATARLLGASKQGVISVRVTPLEVPRASGKGKR